MRYIQKGMCTIKLYKAQLISYVNRRIVPTVCIYTKGDNKNRKNSTNYLYPRFDIKRYNNPYAIKASTAYIKITTAVFY